MSSRTRPLLALLAMSLGWGYGWTLMKVGLLDAEPFAFNAARMGLSALCLLSVLALTGRPLWPRRVGELVRLGLVQTTLLFTFSTWAIDTGSVGRVAFLVYTMPFFAVLMAWPLLGERVHGLQWLALGSAAAGLCALIRPWEGGLGVNSLLSLGAGISWAVGAIMVKRLQLREPMDLVSMTAWQMVFGTIPLIALAAVVPEAPINWTPRFIAVLFAIAALLTSVGWCLWVYALDRLDTGTASLATLISPVIAVGTAALHFNEWPRGFDLLGMGLIAAALLVLSVQTMRDTTPRQ